MKLNCVNQSDLSLIAEKTKMKITKKKKKNFIIQSDKTFRSTNQRDLQVENPLKIDSRIEILSSFHEHSSRNSTQDIITKFHFAKLASPRFLNDTFNHIETSSP